MPWSAFTGVYTRTKDLHNGAPLYKYTYERGYVIYLFNSAMFNNTWCVGYSTTDPDYHSEDQKLPQDCKLWKNCYNGRVVDIKVSGELLAEDQANV